MADCWRESDLHRRIRRTAVLARIRGGYGFKRRRGPGTPLAVPQPWLDSAQARWPLGARVSAPRTAAPDDGRDRNN